MTPRHVWLAVLAFSVAAEARSLAKHDGATLSEVTRAVFRTDTTEGRLVFLAAWAALSHWYPRHILKETL